MTVSFFYYSVTKCKRQHWDLHLDWLAHFCHSISVQSHLSLTLKTLKVYFLRSMTDPMCAHDFQPELEQLEISIFLIFFFSVLFIRVWRGWASSGKRWSLVLLCTNQNLATFIFKPQRESRGHGVSSGFDSVPLASEIQCKLSSSISFISLSEKIKYVPRFYSTCS